MGRPVRIAVVVLAALGAVCLPTAAFADGAVPASNNTFVMGNDNQLAANDIFNAGHDNTVGSYNGGQSGVGVGDGMASGDDAQAVASSTFVMGNGNQLAGDDIFNAGHDNTVGSVDGGSSGVGVGEAMAAAAGSTMVE
ncbi:hypothetical protein [Kitasatospora mediocidica]|uniref:hypothetical protein n=1 Tax=Kitasatospora mediocidica TaxID=58352 RepID=UPI00055BDC2F|nr:hypothetical protein [Kitasatospora mediocidica]